MQFKILKYFANKNQNGALRGSFEFGMEVAYPHPTKGMQNIFITFCKMKHFKTENNSWISFPQEQYTDEEGNNKYANLIKPDLEKDKDFKEAIYQLLREFLQKNSQKQEPSPPPQPPPSQPEFFSEEDLPF